MPFLLFICFFVFIFFPVNHSIALHPGWPVDISDERIIDSAPVYGDIDNDGAVEIIMTTPEGDIYVLNSDGTVKWTKHVDGSLGQFSTPALADLDKNGSLEIIFGTFQDFPNKVFVLRNDGSDFAGWPKVLGHQSITSPVIADINSDGVLDIVAATHSDTSGLNQASLYVWNANGTNLSGWPKIFTLPGNFIDLASTPSVGDVDGDGLLEVVSSFRDGKVHIWNHDGSSVNGWPIDVNDQSGFLALVNTAIGDVDNDGELEVVGIGGGFGSLYIWNSNGAVMSGLPQTLSAAVAPPVLSDLDGDGDLEIIAHSNNDLVNAWHHNGAPVAGWPVTVQTDIGNPHWSPVVVGDINGDGSPEVIAAGHENKVYAWKGGGSTVSGWPKSTSGSLLSSLAMGELDNDGKVEVIAVDQLGEIYMWDAVGDYSPQSMNWPMYHHDMHHTGNHPIDDNPGSPSNLSSHWKFEESSWNGTIGEVIDSSESNNHGTSFGGVNTVPVSQVDRAADFDGVNDAVVVDSPDLEMSTALTLAAWIHPSTPTGSNVGTVLSREGEYVLVVFPDLTLRYALANSSPGWNWVNTGVSVSADSWSHVVLSYSSISQEIRLFLDGVELYTRTGNGPIIDQLPNLDEFQIGNRQRAGQEGFKGLIDDVRVYDRALSSEEIVSLLDGGSSTPVLPEVAFSTGGQMELESIGTTTVTVELSALTDADVTVPILISGSASEGGSADFTISPNAVSIPSGTLGVDLTLTIHDDGEVEPDETVILTLGTPVNAVLGVSEEYTLTIEDNDEGVIPTAVGHWPLDEDFWDGSIDEVLDIGSNGNGGQSVDGAQTTANGQFGRAGNFSGGDDAVVVDSPDLEMSTALTLAAWIHPSTPTGSNVGTVLSREGEYVLVVFPDLTLRYALANSSPGWNWVNTGVSVSADSWSHVVLSYSSISQEIRLFLDGVELYTRTGNGPIIDQLPNLDEFQIGNRQRAGQEGFKGLIDDVRVYDRALSSEEIVSLLDGGSSTPVLPEVAFSTGGQMELESIGTTTVTVELSALTDADVTVPILVSGSASEGGSADFTISPNAVSIPSGTLGVDLTLTIHDDGEVEPDETVILTLGTPVNAVLGVPEEYTLTIEDNDEGVIPTAVGHWPLDEDFWDGSIDEVLDIGSNGNGGQSVDGAQTTANGQFGRAGNFSGGDDAVVVDSPDLEMSTALTLAAWIHPSTPTGSNVGTVLSREGEYVLVVFPDLTLRYVLANSSPGWNWVNTGVSVSAGSWSHVVLSYSSISQEIRLFLDGVELYTRTGNGPIIDQLPNLDEFQIGNRQRAGQEGFKGLIDDVRVYDRALSSEEIVSLLDGGSSTPVLPEVAFSTGGQMELESIGTTTVTVELSALTDADVTVPILISGSASEGGSADFTISPNAVSIPSGTLGVDLTLTIHDDGEVEPDETVILTLGTPVNAVLGVPEEYTLTIEDNDEGVIPTAVGHWPLDEDFWDGSIDEVLDIGSNGNGGQSVDGAQTTANGQFGRAGNFSGGDDAVVVDSPDLEMSTALTLAAWIHPSTPTGSNVGTVLSREGEYVLVVFPDLTLRYVLANSSPGWNWVNTGVSVSAGSWSHVVLSYSSISQEIRLFLDGVELYTRTGNGPIIDQLPNLDEFQIGNRQRAGQEGFKGLIDDVRVYDRALSSEEIVSLLDGGSSTPVLPEVAFSTGEQMELESIGTTTVTVELSALTDADVTVPILISGSASEGGSADFTISPNAVSIPSGTLGMDLTLTIHDDGEVEPDETVILTLGTPVNAVLGLPEEYTLTIEDNDEGVIPTAVGHWPLDEGFWNGSIDEVLDISGNGNGGQSVDGAQTTANGQFGRAGNFSGGDDAVVVDSPDLEMSTALTLAAWIHPSTPTGSNVGTVLSREGEYVLVVFPDLTLRYALANSSPGWNWVNTGVSVSAGSWSHVVLSYSSISQEIRLFLDGIELYTRTGNGVIIDRLPDLDEFQIGNRQRSGQEGFKGLIDDVRVYDFDLSVDEIRVVMDHNPSSSPTGEEVISAEQFELNLYGGWNLVSTPIELIDSDVMSVLRDPESNEPLPVESVWIWEDGDYFDATHFDCGTGYWVKIPQDSRVVLVGETPESVLADLEEGWNLIGVKGMSAVALSEFSATITKVWTWDNITKAYYLLEDDSELLHPGFGYWLFVE